LVAGSHFTIGDCGASTLQKCFPSATNQQGNFRRAVNSNLFWSNFSDKKVTLGKKLFAWVFTVFMAVMGLVGPISVLSMLVLNMMGTPIGSEIFPLSLMGILPAVAALLLW
jgi:hypothetical protein